MAAGANLLFTETFLIKILERVKLFVRLDMKLPEIAWFEALITELLN